MNFEQNLCAQEKLTVHYSRAENIYKDWTLWAWNETDKKEGIELPALNLDEHGLIFEINYSKLGLAGKKIGLLPKYGDWEDKDGPDRFYGPEIKSAEIFIRQDDPKIYSSYPGSPLSIASVKLDGAGEISVLLSKKVSRDFFTAHPAFINTPQGKIKIDAVEFCGYPSKGTVVSLFFAPGQSLDFMEINKGNWILNIKDLGAKPIFPGRIMDSAYFQSKERLGAIIENGATTIRVFAPSACEAYVLLYDAHDSGSEQELPMTHAGAGVWEYKTDKNLKGKYYRLRIKREGAVFEGIDPYSRCNTAHDGKGLITVSDSYVENPPLFDVSETVIYEMHLRDFTIDPLSGIKHKGKYAGAAQESARHEKYADISTGLDHLVELGINTVHFLPGQDFENDENSNSYSWGYMPVHFNSPEGWYATRTYDNSRVEELKYLISALHKKGIKAVMDVVYNHTAEIPPDKVFGLGAMAGTYYYRQKPDGSLYNGSGCGNEFRSESPMGKKFLIDSLKYWAREYKIDGFRFDLMGLIDMETIKTALSELKKINPHILVYGEPWTAGETPIQPLRKGAQRSMGFAVFNDTFRDALKGGVFDMSKGYAQAGLNRDKVMAGIKGSIDDFADSPLETINYVSCHDNHTLWDRITLSSGEETTLSQRKSMDKLANAVILTSQGLPFLHSGEEFLRTKNGESNSYNLPDSINMLDWTLKKINYDVFEYYRGLIKLRKQHPAFRMKTAAQVRRNLKFYEEMGLPVSPPCIAYTLDGKDAGDRWEKIVVLINPGKEKAEFKLPAGIYKIAVDGQFAYETPAYSASGKATAAPFSLMVLFSSSSF